MNEREIFMAALDRESPDERNRYLDEACGNDQELRLRVDALLQSYADSGSFLERPVLADEKTLGFNPPLDATTPQPPADDPPDLPDPSSDPISLDFLQPSDSPDSLGRLGQYEVREVVGRGGMGLVLKANDTKLNRVVAVKVLAPELASNATARKRFVREAQAVAAVSHHHVVTIYAVEEIPLPYLVMEFIDGQSLQDKIDRQGQLSLKEILRIGQQIAAGLAAAHGHGIIHRDIKPANILLQNGVERVQITDFGLARAVDDVEITRPGEVAGTPQFMSPEQAQGQRVDSRSDLFALGSVLYTMCTGRPPFRADTTVAILRRICDDTARPIREVNPDVPDWLVEIVERLLAKQPEDRFQTAAEVAELLGKHLAHVQDPGSTPFPGRLPAAERRPGGRARRRRFWLAAAIILLALMASLGISEAAGVTHLAATVIRIATGEGTLVIEIDDPHVSITIDGEDLVIAGAGPQEVRLKPGQYRVQATSGGRLVKQELVTIQRGGRQLVQVALERAVTQPAKDAHRLDELSKRPVTQSAEVAHRLDELCKWIEDNSWDAGLLEARGRLYAQLGRHDEAARDFAAALGIANSDIQRWKVYDSAARDDEVFSRVAALVPHDKELRIARGRFLAYHGQYERASLEYAPLIDTCRPGWETDHYLRLLLVTGRDEEYRDICRRLNSQFGEAPDVAEAHWLVVVCTAGPDSGVEPARIVRWARQAVAAVPQNPVFLFDLGGAYYRAGEYKQAVHYLEESNVRFGTQRTAHNPLLLAMAHHRLGQRAASREWYETGIEVLKSRTPQPGSDYPPVGSLWDGNALSEWLHLNHMSREAKAVLGLTEEPSKETDKPTRSGGQK